MFWVLASLFYGLLVPEQCGVVDTSLGSRSFKPDFKRRIVGVCTTIGHIGKCTENVVFLPVYMKLTETVLLGGKRFVFYRKG